MLMADAVLLRLLFRMNSVLVDATIPVCLLRLMMADDMGFSEIGCVDSMGQTNNLHQVSNSL